MIWKICIRPRPDAFHRRQVYVQARTKDEAFELVGDPFALAWPCPDGPWPGLPGERIHWSD